MCVHARVRVRVYVNEIVCVTVCKQPPSMGATVYVCGCCDCGDGMCVIVSVQGSLWITDPSEKLCVCITSTMCSLVFMGLIVCGWVWLYVTVFCVWHLHCHFL